MAHNEHIKARAMALLLVGNSARGVAKQMQIPRRTIRRWEREAWVLVRASFTPEERAQIREFCALFPGLTRRR